jgi:hypothetical protein
MSVDRVVSCMNESCSNQAPITTITMPFFAPGIVSLPQLYCATCGCELYQHHDADDVERPDQLGRPAVLPGDVRKQMREAIRRELVAWGYADVPIESLSTDLTGAILRLAIVQSALNDQRRVQLVEALAKHAESRLDWHIMVIGRGEQRYVPLDELVRALGAEELTAG